MKYADCCGVNAALNDFPIELADNWLRHVKDVRNANQGYTACIMN